MAKTEIKMIDVTLEAQIDCLDYAYFQIPEGAEIADVSCWKGRYTIHFTSEEYEDIELNDVDNETSRDYDPTSVTVHETDSGEELYIV